MFFQPGLDRLPLVRGQNHGVRTLSNAVPDVFRQLDAFSDGKLEKIGSGLAHGGSIGRWLCGVNADYLFGAAFFAFTFDAFTCATAFAASIRP